MKEKPKYLHELEIHDDLGFDEDLDYAIYCLYQLIMAGTKHMNRVEPEDDNFVYVRLPIETTPA